MTAAVIDASAVVDFLRATLIGDRVAARIPSDEVDLHMPHLCSIEVASALRGLVLGGKVSADGAGRSLDDLRELLAERHPVEEHLARIWQLRDNLTVYDATYVVLAESLECPLVTTDHKFNTPTVRRLIAVEVIS